MSQQPSPPANPNLAGDIDWERFNTEAHRVAQANCYCLIHCAVDGDTRKAVAANLAYARRIGDMGVVPILIAQLTGPCTLAPAPKQA